MKPTRGTAPPLAKEGRGPDMRKYLAEQEKRVTKKKRFERKIKHRRRSKDTRTDNHKDYARDVQSPTTDQQEHRDIFGADIRYRPPAVLRIGYKNVHGFPSEGNDVKYDYLQSESSEHGYGFNIQSFGETNRRWNVLPHYQQLRAITSGWWERPSYQITYMRDGDKNEIQYGGVATVCDKKVTSYKFKQGLDEMGRWTWITLRGKNGVHTTVISVYRPCESTCEGSVEMQQLRYLREKFDESDQDPLNRFDADLKALIESKLDEEHRIILMGDFNISMTTRNRFTKMLCDLGLKEAILDKYATQNNTPSTTFQGGSTVLDGLWTTDNVDMVQGGHDEITPSGDHCWIWGDFTVQSLLGGGIDQFTKPLARKLSCKIPRVLEKYQTLLDAELQRHDLDIKIEQMVSKGIQDFEHNKSVSQKYKKIYDKLNKQVEDAIKYADKRCKKGHTGQVPFTPNTKKFQGDILMWKAVLRYRTHRKKNLRLMKRQMKKWRFHHEWYHLSIVQIKNKIRAARAHYRRYKPRAWEDRRTFLGNLAQDYADRDSAGNDAAHHLHQLQRQESERAAFKRIQYALKPQRSSVNRVEVEQDDGSRKIINDKEDMEKEIARVNVEKLLQANNTPLREEPLRTHFGEDGNFDKWNDFIDNKLHLPDTYPATEGTRLWCNKMQNTTITRQPTTWTEEEYVHSWRKMKENTTSLPGPSFSHYKAARLGSIAATIYSSLALFPMLLGFAPDAWCKSVASMIPKKKEDLRPAKLRLITLLHGLFNHNNKWVGKQMMTFGEQHDRLAKEQYGSRKKKSAGQHALNKRLILDYLRIQKLAAILISNDARSCYDRIIIMVSYITMVLFGVARETAQCLLTCLMVMLYFIRTVFGDSDLSYGGSQWERTPHGNGQGNGSGPALWTCISSPLFTILREQGYGIHLKGPISSVHLHIVGFGFVDDADLIQGISPGQPLSALFRAAQKMITLWEEVLRITGGALDVKDKSDWTLISFEWKNGIAKLQPINPENKIRVKDHENDLVEMKQLPPTKARETLGVMQAPSGDETEEYDYLENKVKKWVQKIRYSSLQRQDVTRAVSITIMRTLRYGLIATALSYDQCTDLTKLLLKGVLPKMGIIRSANMAMATIPRSMRGVGIIHLYILQLVDHLKVICDHGGKNTETGKLLTIELDAMNLQAGIGGSPLDCDPATTPWVEHCWWSNTLEAARKFNVTINGFPQTLYRWTRNDSFLMKDFQEFYRTPASSKFLCSINRVRLYYQVVTRSDIQLACGWRCCSDIFGTYPIQSHSSQAYQWPEQQKPPRKDFQNWLIALDEVYGITPTHTVFSQSCRGGSWRQTSSRFHQWYYMSDEDILWERDPIAGWVKWIAVTGRTRAENRRYTRTNITTVTQPRSTTVASVTHYGNAATLLSTGVIETDPEPTLVQEDWTSQHLTLPDDQGLQFIEDIQQRKAMTTGDGSCKYGHSVGGFMSFAEDNDGDIEIGFQGGNDVPLDMEESDAYTGELGGIAGAVTTTNTLCSRFQITHGAVTHGVDNAAALKNCFGPDEPDTTTPCFHLVKFIRSAIAQSPIKWTGRKVKAHQDRDKSYEDLDCWGKANVHADRLATEHMTRVRHHDPPCSVRNQDEGWTVSVNEKLVVRNFESTIISHCTSQTAKTYWSHRMGFSPENIALVDWQVFRKTTTYLSPHQQLFIMKHCAGISATGRNMLRRAQRDTDECPRCGAPDEHTEHVIQCVDPDATKIFMTAFADLGLWLQKTTSPAIEATITDAVLAYREGTDIDLDDYDDTTVTEALRTQLQLGLFPFLCGFLSTHWAVEQQRYLDSIESRRCGKKWTAQLSVKLIAIVQDMWKHRNDILHGNSNTIHDRLHEEINDLIEQTYKLIPSHLRVFSPAEQRFFNGATVEQIQKRTLQRKKQWIKKTSSIIKSFRKREMQNPSVQTLYRAMGVTTASEPATVSYQSPYQSMILEEWSAG